MTRDATDYGQSFAAKPQPLIERSRTSFLSHNPEGNAITIWFRPSAASTTPHSPSLPLSTTACFPGP